MRKTYITKGIYSRSCNRNKTTEVLEALEAKMVRVVGLQANCNYFQKKKKKDLYELSLTMDIWTCPTPLGLLILVQASVKI